VHLSKLVDMKEIGEPRQLIFCSFVEFDPLEPVYQESESKDKLRDTLEKIIVQLNQSRSGSKDKLSLLFFDYFLQHLSRVARIITKPFGNGLLIGLGGNGRKTIAKIAAFVNNCNNFRIELHKTYGIPEWQEDLRNLYKTLGIDNKKIVFQFSDKDIKQELFIEDINNILNVGELTSLFNEEDLDEIHYELEKQLKKTRSKL